MYMSLKYICYTSLYRTIGVQPIVLWGNKKFITKTLRRKESEQGVNRAFYVGNSYFWHFYFA